MQALVKRFAPREQTVVKGPFRTKEYYDDSKNSKLTYAVVILLRPPNLLRRGPLF